MSSRKQISFVFLSKRMTGLEDRAKQMPHTDLKILKLFYMMFFIMGQTEKKKV